MATMLKDTLKYTIPDWHTTNYSVSTNTDRQCEASCDVRQQCLNIQNDTKINTKWDQFYSTQQIDGRLKGIEKWKHKLSYTKLELENEISQLQSSKDSAEAFLFSKNVPNSIVVQCSTIRDARMGADLVNDLPALNLQKEIRVLENLRLKMNEKINDAFQLESLLKESRQQLISDIVDKDHAICIDSGQLYLKDTSPNIYLKSNSTEIPPKSVTPQDWDDYSTFNKTKADSLIELSKTLRQEIVHTIDQTSTDLQHQQNQTDLALRNRVHEYQQAKNQLEWQKNKLETEIENMKEEINNLGNSIGDKYPPLKLAQTRLNNRTRRNHVELCRDSPQYALIHEVKNLESTIESLTDAHNQSKQALNCLEEQLYQTNCELDCKTKSLDLDGQCLKIRNNK